MQEDTIKTGVVRAEEPDHMHIGQVAQATGLTQRTIRYYEELGLLPAPERTQGDFRLYTLHDVRRLTEIARLKELLGISLAEVKVIVEADEAREQLRSEYHAVEETQARLDKLHQLERLTAGQLAILDRKMAQMADMRSELEARVARYRLGIAELSRREAAEAQA
jgi:DNA-binding transcriptional MerR regulator